LCEKPDAEAQAVLDIKPKREKMVNKSKSDARSEKQIRSYATTSNNASTRAGKMEFKVQEVEEEPPFPQWGRRPLSIN
jgi:hypothetical protein